ncbi:hypothetical protein LINPERPRIM_LOCUS36580, partial [Linum perenne]
PRPPILSTSPRRSSPPASPTSSVEEVNELALKKPQRNAGRKPRTKRTKKVQKVKAVVSLVRLEIGTPSSAISTLDELADDTPLSHHIGISKNAKSAVKTSARRLLFK